MAETSKTEALEQHLRDTHRETLVVALAQAAKALRDDPSKAHLEAYQAARRAIDAYDEQAAGPVVASVPNRHQAATHLQDEGWRLTPKTFYLHVRKGLITPRADGSFTLEALNAYAVANLSRKDGSHEPGLLEQLRQDRLEADIRCKRAQAESQELKNAIAQGQYIEADRVAAGLAARAHRLRQDGQQWIKAEATAVVGLCNGDDSRIPDVIHALRKGMDEWLASYASPAAWEKR